MNLEQAVFSIQSEEDFNRVALQVFGFQREHCLVYRNFIEQLNKPNPHSYLEIPFLPISFFKTHDVVSDGNYTATPLTFLSSATTGVTRSKHFVLNPEIYTHSFLATYHQFIGDPANQVVLALLPNYLEQGNSSLVFMVDELIRQTASSLSGFLLHDLSEIQKRYLQALDSGKKVVIFGVSYALLDLAAMHIDLSEACIIETGGMKGRRKEMTKEELHSELQQGLNVSYIRSEYGMTELLSQAYSDENQLFTCPAWMKVVCRDVNDPFSLVKEGKTGGINVIDLANIYSCSFIATQDLGQLHGDSFSVMGRFDLADLRGCNLMVE